MVKRFSLVEMKVGLSQLCKTALIDIVMKTFAMVPKKTKLRMWNLLKRNLAIELRKSKLGKKLESRKLATKRKAKSRKATTKRKTPKRKVTVTKKRGRPRKNIQIVSFIPKTGPNKGKRVRFEVNV